MVHCVYLPQSGPDYPLCPLYHGRGPRLKGAPADQLPIFYHAVLMFERSVYAYTKSRHLFGGKSEKSAPPQIRKSRLRVREKGRRLTLVWVPPNG